MRPFYVYIEHASVLIMLIELNVTDHFKPDSLSDVYQRGQDSMTTLRANLAKYYVNGARSDLT